MIPKGRISKNNVLLQWSSLPMYLDGKYPRDEDLLVYRRGFYFVLEGRSYDIEDDLQEEGILHLKLGNILATGRKLDPHDLFDSVILEQFIHSNIDSLRVSAHQGTCKKTHRGVALIGTRPQRQCPEILTFGSIQDCPSDQYPGCLTKKDFNCPSTHAEQDAFRKALRASDAGGSEWMAVIQLKFQAETGTSSSPAGEVPYQALKPVPSGKRLCHKCLPIMVSYGIQYLFLLHEDGWYVYTLPSPILP